MRHVPGLMAAVPGVRAVGTSELGTLTGSDMGSNVTIEGSKDQEFAVEVRDEFGPLYWNRKSFESNSITSAVASLPS